MTTEGQMCKACPWHEAKTLPVPVKSAAIRGDWFCCHVHMGTCFGAALWGAVARKKRGLPVVPEP